MSTIRDLIGVRRMSAVSAGRLIGVAGFLLLLFCSRALAAVALLPATIVIGDLEQSYTGETHQVSTTVAPEGAYTVTVTYNGKANLPTNAGTYTVKVTATSATHKGSASAKLVIKKVPLTVTAENKGRLVGAANPVFTFSYEGFVNGETSAVVDKKPTGAPTAKSTSLAGTYTINVVGGSDLNYDFIRVPGVLTVAGFPGGSYETLLFVSGTDNPVGKLDLVLPTKGDVFTGVLHLTAETKSVAFKGRLLNLASDYSNITGSLSITVGSHVYTLNLVFDAAGVTPALTLESVSVADSYETVALVAFTKASPAPWTGAYTLALTNPVPGDIFRDYPVGASISSMTIAYTGALSMSGMLADGTTFTVGAKPDAEGSYRFLVRPHGARADSFFEGSFVFVPHPDANRAGRYYVSTAQPDSAARIFWAKAAKPLVNVTDKDDPTYPDGFAALDYFVSIDPWLPPAAATKATKTVPAQPAISLVQRLGLVLDEKGAGVLSVDHGAEYFGEYDFDLPLTASVSSKALIAPIFNPLFKSRANWRMSVNASTGRFSGGFTLKDTVAISSDPVVTKVVPRNISFQGVLRQAPAGDTLLGVGYLMLPPLPDDTFHPTAVSSEVTFRPVE